MPGPRLTLARALAVSSVALAMSAGVARGAGSPCSDPAGRPWCNTHLGADQRARLLIGALTESEKISLLEGDDLLGVVGGPNRHTGTAFGIARLSVPTVHFTDGTAGIRQGPATAMPVSLALAATFDPALGRLAGQLLAVEAKDKGNDVIFGPTLTLMRTPLGGRTFQAFGEDPLLQSSMGAAEIDGIQSRGVIANANILAANSQEGYSPNADLSRPGQALGPAATQGSRFTDNAIVDERALRELYLAPFEAAVKSAHVGTVMCAYNQVNGSYSCQNSFLLRTVLSGWGFSGFTLSDYGAAHSTVGSLRGGLDFEPWPPGGAYDPSKVQAALTAGQVTAREIDAHIQRYLRTLIAFGVFDRAPYANNQSAIDEVKDGKTAEQIAQSAVTLLVNRGSVLPLRASRLHSLAIIDPSLNQFVTGGGSSNVTPFFSKTAQAAIAERAGRHARVRVYDGSDPVRVAALARSADVAVVIAPTYQTEGVDRRCLSLECPPAFGNEDALVDRVAAVNRHTIVVLESGGPVLTPWRNHVAGLVEAWYPGEEGGTAIAHVLFGDSDAAGRLPVTFPANEAQTPTAGDRASYPGINDRTSFKEGVLIGYRWYDAHGAPPAFPFGFGLSYTRFAYGPLSVHASPASSRLAQVSFMVDNVGGRAGIDVPQLYVAIPSPSPGVPEPPRQLRAFERVSLPAGGHTKVTFKLTGRDLAWWSDRARGWRIADGCYRLLVGSSSRDTPDVATLGVGRARCPGAAARVDRATPAAATSTLL